MREESKHSNVKDGTKYYDYLQINMLLPTGGANNWHYWDPKTIRNNCTKIYKR